VFAQLPANDAANVMVKLDAGGTALLARITCRSPWICRTGALGRLRN
jgi:hypothetical protein